MNEIEKARQNRIRVTRSAQRERYLNQFAFEYNFEGPRGILGRLFVGLLTLIPPILMIASLRLTSWLYGQQPDGSGSDRAA